MAKLNGKDIVVKVRELGTTGAFLQLVCETSSGINKSRSESTVETKTCGTLRSRGSLTWSVPISGIVETAPATGFLSYSQLDAYITNDTDLEVELSNSANDIYNVGECFLSEFNLEAASDGFATFTGTLAGTGNLDIIP